MSRTNLRRILVVTPVALLAIVGVALLASARADRPAGEVDARWGTPPSQFAEIGGLRVHYRDEGSGPVVLLVHGTFASLHTWDAWTAALTTGFRVVRLDLPGHGLTGPDPTGGYGMERTLAIVAGLMDHLGIQRFSIAGNSLGGHVAWRFAAAHPERVERLVLLDSIGLPFPPPPIVRLGRTPVLNNVMLFATPEILVVQNLREVYGDDDRIAPGLERRYHDLMLREGNRRALRDRLAQDDPDRPELLAAVRAPTLVQWGTADAWVPLSVGEQLVRGIAGARLVTYPGAGHVPHEELPERTVADAIAFLRGT